MTTERPYRATMCEEEAAEALRSEAGRQPDLDVVDVLLDALDEGRLRRMKAA